MKIYKDPFGRTVLRVFRWLKITYGLYHEPDQNGWPEKYWVFTISLGRFDQYEFSFIHDYERENK
jgi:hypothetical protein